MSIRRKQTSNRHTVLCLVAVALALHLFSCSWSLNYFEGSPTAIMGVQDMVGIYARHARRDDLMLGIIIPSTLACVAAYLSRDE